MMNRNEMILKLAQTVIQRNPNRIQNAPWAQNGINAIMNNDAQSGMQLADSLCKSYGLSREQALNQISQSIKLPF